MKSAAFGLTDVGRCRKINQDELLVDPSRGLFAVADGMGGHAAGEVASQMAIEALADTMPDGDVDETAEGDLDRLAGYLERAFREGNRKIFESVESREDWRGMGTTIVAMVARPNRAVIGYVGDSRAYRLRGDALERLTSDHSWVNEQVKLGLLSDDEAHRHPYRNIVTRALGNTAEVQVDVVEHDVRAGDLFLLCSDGLNTMLRDDEIRVTLSQHRDDPEAACQALVRQANDRGGEDNITVIVWKPLVTG